MSNETPNAVAEPQDISPDSAAEIQALALKLIDTRTAVNAALADQEQAVSAIHAATQSFADISRQLYQQMINAGMQAKSFVLNGWSFDVDPNGGYSLRLLPSTLDVIVKGA